MGTGRFTFDTLSLSIYMCFKNFTSDGWCVYRAFYPVVFGNGEEYLKIAGATVIGFSIMGFIGFFVRLIHIPINNLLISKIPQIHRNHRFSSPMTVAIICFPGPDVTFITDIGSFLPTLLFSLSSRAVVLAFRLRL